MEQVKEIRGRFREEQEIIDRALAVKHSIPLPVREFISHFLRNDLTYLLRQCRDSQEALDTIEHMVRVLRIVDM